MIIDGKRSVKTRLKRAFPLSVLSGYLFFFFSCSLSPRRLKERTSQDTLSEYELFLFFIVYDVRPLWGFITILYGRKYSASPTLIVSKAVFEARGWATLQPDHNLQFYRPVHLRQHSRRFTLCLARFWISRPIPPATIFYHWPVTRMRERQTQYPTIKPWPQPQSFSPPKKTYT